MKNAVSPYYFKVFLLLYVTTNIYSFHSVACSTEFTVLHSVMQNNTYRRDLLKFPRKRK